jgi:hypothetical protein
MAQRWAEVEMLFNELNNSLSNVTDPDVTLQAVHCEFQQ